MIRYYRGHRSYPQRGPRWEGWSAPLSWPSGQPNPVKCHGCGGWDTAGWRRRKGDGTYHVLCFDCGKAAGAGGGA